MAQRLALIIAPRYLSNPRLAHLEGTQLLPKRLRALLETYGHYEQIIMELADKEVRRSQLRAVLQSFFQNTGELLFYFYGHGVLRSAGEGVLATSDSEPYDEGISMREVVELANQSTATEVVLILDCCHAGAAMPVATTASIPQNIQPHQGRVLIAACAEHEQGWEIQQEDERRKLGALSALVLDGLGGAAKNDQGEVTAARLGQYIIDQFSLWRQHPVWTAGGNSNYPCKLTWDFPTPQPVFRAIPTIEPPLLTQPPESMGFVGRTDELAYFANCLAGDHLAIIAGLPGVGKTALAIQLAHQVAKQPARIFWHQFHEGEGIETIIWKLAGMLYYHGQTTLWTLLDSSRQSGGNLPPVEVLLDYLIQQLQGQDYVLCLDDFHWVEDDQLVDKAVERLQRILPTGSLKLIVTSQRMPALLKTLSFVPLNGLSLADTSQLLANYNINLSPELMRELYERTEGNAELLMLAIHTLARRQRPEQVVKRLVDEDDIETFLLKEVDERLNDKQKLAISGVAALLGYPGTRNAIEVTLASGNLKRVLHYLANRFLLREQDGKFGYEYLTHAIVQAFYYELLEQSERQAMHHRAGEYYEQTERDTLRSALHYVYAGAPDHAVAISTADVRAVIGQGQARMLKRLLDEIDSQTLTLEMQAKRAIALGQIMAFLGEPTTAKAHFTNAVQLLEHAPTNVQHLVASASLGMGTVLEYEDPEQAQHWIRAGLATVTVAEPLLHAGLLLRAGSIAIGKSEHTEAVTLLEQALPLIPLQPPNPLRTSILINLNLAYEALGQVDASRTCAAQALALAEVLNDYYALLTIRSNVGLDRERAGEWPAAISDYENALSLAEQMGAIAEGVRIHNLLGTLYRRQGNHAKAEAHLRQALTQAREADLKEHLAQTLPSWAYLLLRQQQWAAAETILQEAEQLAIDHDWAYVLPETYTGLALVHWGRHQFEPALAQATKAATVARQLALPFDEGRALGVQGQLYAAFNQSSSALDAFQQSLLLLENTDKIEALRVTIHYGQALVTAGEVEAGQTLQHKAITALKTLGFEETINEDF